MTRGTTRSLLLAGTMGIVFLMNAACAEPEKDEPQDDKEVTEAVKRPDPMSREERLAVRERMRDIERVEKVSQDDLEPATQGVVGEVPNDLLDKIFADLETKTGAQRSSFKLLQASATQWNDGALGCPEPGQAYTQAIVDGYQVIIDFEGQSFDYHASSSGFFKLCTGFRPNR